MHGKIHCTCPMKYQKSSYGICCLFTLQQCKLSPCELKTYVYDFKLFFLVAWSLRPLPACFYLSIFLHIPHLYVEWVLAASKLALNLHLKRPFYLLPGFSFVPPDRIRCWWERESETPVIILVMEHFCAKLMFTLLFQHVPVFLFEILWMPAGFLCLCSFFCVKA